MCANLAFACVQVHFKQASSPLVFALQQPLLWACVALGVGASSALATGLGWRMPSSAGVGYLATAAALYACRQSLVAAAVTGSYLASCQVSLYVRFFSFLFLYKEVSSSRR